MLSIADAGGFDETRIRTKADISNAIEAGIREPQFRHLAPLLCKVPTARPSAQQVFLSNWPHELEAIGLPPKEVETTQATARNHVARRKRGRQMPQISEPDDTPGVIRRRRKPTAIAQKGPAALRNDQQSHTTAAEHFSQLLRDYPGRRFT